jgi:hypothetical protein
MTDYFFYVVPMLTGANKKPGQSRSPGLIVLWVSGNGGQEVSGSLTFFGPIFVGT